MSNPLTMMMNKRKIFYRCRYHGQYCEVCDEIRSIPFGRAKERKEIKNTVNEGVDQYYDEQGT